MREQPVRQLRLIVGAGPAVVVQSLVVPEADVPVLGFEGFNELLKVRESWLKTKAAARLIAASGIAQGCSGLGGACASAR